MALVDAQLPDPDLDEDDRPAPRRFLGGYRRADVDDLVRDLQAEIDLYRGRIAGLERRLVEANARAARAGAPDDGIGPAPWNAIAGASAPANGSPDGSGDDDVRWEASGPGDVAASPSPGAAVGTAEAAGADKTADATRTAGTAEAAAPGTDAPEPGRSRIENPALGRAPADPDTAIAAAGAPGARATAAARARAGIARLGGATPVLGGGGAGLGSAGLGGVGAAVGAGASRRAVRAAPVGAPVESVPDGEAARTAAAAEDVESVLASARKFAARIVSEAEQEAQLKRQAIAADLARLHDERARLEGMIARFDKAMEQTRAALRRATDGSRS